jgi:glycosyltransferase involved in cell wall biosynthesis
MTNVTGRPAAGESARTGKISVPTPWYPTPFDRMGGSFVATYARLVARLGGPVEVVHAQEWAAGAPAAAAALRPAFEAVLDVATVQRSLVVPGAYGPVQRVPVFVVGGESVPQRAEAAVRDVRRALGRLDGEIVHGHVGYLGGLTAVRLAEPGARVFATEHSSGVRDLLSDPQGRDHYAEVLERVDRLYCVTSLVRNQVLDVLPQYAERIEVLPNPVDFAGVPRRTAPPTSLVKWVFVGALAAAKGVERLLQAFVVAAHENPDVELTMVGDGPLKDRLLEIARDGGVADRLHLAGRLAHDEVLAALPQHDLLFAPSEYETFHLAVLEAVAAGLPVVVTRSGGPQETLAGVEDRVGRFVDVEPGPEQLIEAWRGLGADLGSLDLAGAAHELAARMSPDAVLARLAQAYGLAVPDPALTAPAAIEASAALPERVVVLAVSGWRRYSVRVELPQAAALGLTTLVVTRDAELGALAAGLDQAVVTPEALLGLPAGGGATPVAVTAVPASIGVREFAGDLRRRLQGRPARPSGVAAASPPAEVRLLAEAVAGATVLLTDVQSAPTAALLLARDPSCRVVVELPRGDGHGELPDGLASSPWANP